MGVLLSMGGRQPSSKVARVIWRLRPVLLVAFFFWLMVWITTPGGPGPAFQVEWLGGQVTAGGKRIESALPNFGLGDGQRLTTGPDGRARLARMEAELLVGPDTNLEVPRVAPLELRLYGGELELTAEGQVSTDRGVVLLDGGRARLVLTAEELRLEGLAGVTTLQDAEGDHPVGPGEVLLADRGGVRALPPASPGPDAPE